MSASMSTTKSNNKNIMIEKKTWPECDPLRQDAYHKVMDTIFYQYMRPILKKGEYIGL